MAYTLGASGIAVLISSVVKKSSVAAILTFVTLMLLLTIVSSILSGNSIDTWFMLDVAGTNINASFTPGYYDAARDAAVMSAWGLAAGAAGYLLFRRREL